MFGSASNPLQSEALFKRLLERSSPEYRLTQPDSDRAVFEDDEFRWYCYPAGAVQGVVSRVAPQTLLLPNQQAMALAMALIGESRQALDLGTGCGGILRTLSTIPGIHVRSVESNEAMLTLAQEFFTLPASAELNVADARQFLDEDKGSYGLIVCDVFDGVCEPGWLASESFYRALRLHLAPRGAIALNLLPGSEEELRHHLLAASGHFGGIGLCQFSVIGNIVLVLQVDPLPTNDAWRASLTRVLPDQAEAVGQWLHSLRRIPVGKEPARD